MAGVGDASLVLSIISSVDSNIDVTRKLCNAVEGEVDLPTSFLKSTTELPLISRLLRDANRYITYTAGDSIGPTFISTLEDCKVQAAYLRALFEKVMPEEGDSRSIRYWEAARTIGKGGRIETLIKGILDNLQILVTKFPEVTTQRGREQLAEAIEEWTGMEPSLPDGFEQTSAYTYYGSGLTRMEEPRNIETPRGTGLRLLCLDGGGVRGLSSLLILKRLMETINQDNPPNPCDVFDMISGTSSGGLIALMLGRLRMSVDETIESYRMLAGRVFKNRSRLGWKGNLQGRFSAESLENAIKDILLKHGLDENTRLKDQELMSCKVFVTATSSSSLNPIALRSYTSPHQKEDIGVRIWEAARATSAASTFFDPIKINGRMYNDGGIGLNNPINLLWTEARSIWSDDRRRFSDNIKCIVSIGTGQDIISRAEVLGGVEKALVANSTDATSTAYEFAARHKDLHRSQRYFRFNAEVGLHNVGLNEADHLAQIASEVESYTLDGEIDTDFRICSLLLESATVEGVQSYHTDPSRSDRGIYGFQGSWDSVIKAMDNSSEYTASDSGYASTDNLELFQDQFVEFLFTVGELTKLLDAAATEMVSQAFQTSFSNILVRYSKSLQNSCKTTAEKEAVRFILNKCQHITRAIWVKVQSEAESSQDQDFSYPDLEALPTSKQETLERHRYLQDTNVDITYEMSTVDDDFMDEPEDATEDKANWNDPFVLEEVKDFLREHEAFAELLLRFDYVVHGSLLHLAILNDDETAVLHLLRDGMELGDQHRDGQMAFALAVELAFKRHQSTLVDLMLNFRDQSRQDLIDQESLKIDSGEFLESLNEGSGSMKDIIICDCEIPEVIHQLQSSVSERKVSQERIDVEQERDLLRMLSNVVVITGSEAAYEAMACGNYLEKYWGKLGIDLLSAIVDGHKQIVLNQPDFLARPIKALVASNRIILSFANVHSWLDKFDLRKALLWLCQAVRLPPASGTFTQLIHLSTICEIKFPFSRYFIKPLEPLILKEDNCWVELFNPGVVASRCLRRSLRRNSGRGLEIPFDMMVQLAAVENCSWIESRSHNTSSREDGGYVLLGFYTALIPMQASEDGKSIQWHLEHSKGEILQPSSLASIRGDWLMVKDPNVFVKTKCFIGWCGRANVMLGTQDLPNTVAWSGLPTRNRTLHKKGNTATAQVAGTGGPIQIALQGAQNYEYVTNRQHFKANSAYAGAITEISRQVALVYDSETKQAWLVPKISLLLHLCHTYFQFYKNSSSQVVDPIPFAVPSADGSQAAEDAFAGNGGTVVIEHSPTDQILLRQVLVDINTCISEAVKTREAPKGSILLGSELMDLVIKPGTGSDLVEVKMSSPADAWLNLVELVDAILVCSKLGQALKPVPEVPLPTTPCDCMNLPTQSLYLAAHLWCLEKLLERRNCHVSYLQTAVVEIKKDRVWGLSGQPFRQCQHPLNNTYWADSKNILQKVSRQGLLHSKISATPSVWPVPLQGAVVFGIPPQNVLQKKK